MSGEAKASRLHVHLDRKRIEIATEQGTDSWRIDRVRRASKQYGRFWALHFEDAARLLALVPMRARTALVLWHLCGTLDSVAWTRIIQSEVAEALAMERSGISRALADLCERGIVCQHGKRAGHYRMSLWLSWRGTAGDYQRERRSRQAEIDNAAAWHTARAVANIDADDEATVRYWRFADDPAATALRDQHGREADDQPADRQSAAPPQGMDAEEWASFQERRPERASAEQWAVFGAERQPQYSVAEWASIGQDMFRRA
jgi:hypothetical protein